MSVYGTGVQEQGMSSRTDFASEADLVGSFCEFLINGCSPLGRMRFVTEFNYRRGRTDVIAVGHHATSIVISFEAKLHRWREALQQASRNRCFAHQSYVVLPGRTWTSASKHSLE